MSIEETLRSSFKLLIYSWRFVLFFLYSKRNEISGLLEIWIWQIPGHLYSKCVVCLTLENLVLYKQLSSNICQFCDLVYSTKGFKFPCMSTSESCGKSCVSIRAKTSLFIRLTSHLMSMLCFLSDRTFNRQILNLWWAFVGSEDGLYPSVVLFSVSTCLNRWCSKCTFGLAFICFFSILPTYTDLAKRLHGSMRHKFVQG